MLPTHMLQIPIFPIDIFRTYVLSNHIVKKYPRIKSVEDRSFSHKDIQEVVVNNFVFIIHTSVRIYLSLCPALVSYYSHLIHFPAIPV